MGVLRRACARRWLPWAWSAVVAACGGPPAYTGHRGGCTEVPLRLEGSLVVVEVEVEVDARGDGVDRPGRVAAIVDTGSVQTLTLRPEDAARLRLLPNGERRQVTDARGNRLDVAGFTLAGVALGGARFSGVRAWEARHAPDWTPPVDAGHVGRGLLRAERLTVDLPRGRLRLGCPLPAGTVLPLRETADGWETPVTIDGRPQRALWDTAATTSIRRATPGEPGHTAGTEARLGPLHVPLTPLDLPGLPVDVLLGGDVFRAHAVTFDPAAGAVVIE